MAADTDRLTARIVLRAVLPVIKVLLEDDPKTRNRFEGVTATVSSWPTTPAAGPWPRTSRSTTAPSPLSTNRPNTPTTFRFSSLRKMNAMFAGKPVLPRIHGLRNVGLLLKMLGVLMRLKLLMPNKAPKTPTKPGSRSSSSCT